MTEEQKRVWDVRLGIFGSVTTIATAFFGLFYYLGEQKHNLELESTKQQDAAIYQFKQSQFSRKQAAFQKASELMGQLATSTDDPATFSQLTRNFGGHYWGAMILNEDSEVESAMADYRQVLGTTQTNNDDLTARLKDKTDQTLKVLRSSLDRELIELKSRK